MVKSVGKCLCPAYTASTYPIPNISRLFKISRTNYPRMYAINIVQDVSWYCWNRRIHVKYTPVSNALLLYWCRSCISVHTQNVKHVLGSIWMARRAPANLYFTPNLYRCNKSRARHSEICEPQFTESRIKQMVHSHRLSGQVSRPRRTQ